MLQRKLGSYINNKHWAFVVSLEMDPEDVTPEQICLKLADSLSWVEGVGDVEVNDLGEIDLTGADEKCNCEKCQAGTPQGHA